MSGSFDKVLWTLDYNGQLTLSGVGATPNFTSPEYPAQAPWMEHSSKITSLVVEDGITALGSCLLEESAVDTVTFHGNMPQIHGNAFSGVTATVYCPVDKNWPLGKLLPYGGQLTWKYYSAPGVCGKELTWRFDELTGTLIISGKGAMYNYQTQNAPWLYLADSITAVLVEEGVTAIAPYAFEYLPNVTTVTLPARMESIGSYAFRQCSALTYIRIPEGITTLDTQVFYGCTALTDILLPDTLISINLETFGGCTALTVLELPENLTTLGVTAFADCSSLHTIYFSGNAPEILQNAFKNVTANAHFPQKNKTWTSSVMKDYGGSLTWISTEPRGRLGENLRWHLEDNCATLVISGKGAMSALAAYPWSKYADTIKTLVIEKDVTTIADSAFAQLKKLETARFCVSGLTSIGDHAFDGCSKLVYALYTFDEAGKMHIQDLPYNVVIGSHFRPLPDTLTEIGNYAFRGCWNMPLVSFPASLTSIGYYAFAETGVVGALFHGDALSIASNAFLGCPNSKSAYPNAEVISAYVDSFTNANWLKNDMMTDYGTPFRWYDLGLASDTNGGYTWTYDRDTKTMTISGSGQWATGRIYANCMTQMETLIFEEGITITPDEPFTGWKNLKTVRLPESMEKIGSFANTGLTELTIPANVRYIIPNAFAGIQNQNVAFTFLGDSPDMEGVFADASVTAYYPAANESWTEEVKAAAAAGIQGESENGDILWISSCTGIDHVFEGEGIVLATPTCTSEGLIHFDCVNCETGVLEETLPVDPDAHSFLRFPGQEATCTAPGYYTLRCRYCTHTQQGDEIPVEPHTEEVRNSKAPTCTEEGYSGDVYCTVCKSMLKQGEVMGKVPHQEELRNVIAASCSEEGYSGDVYCSACNILLQQGHPEEMLPHQTETLNEIAPTCSTKGYSGDVYCTVCRSTVTPGHAIPTTDHRYGDWVTVIPATISHTGIQRRSCLDCAKMDEESIPKLTVQNPFTDVAKDAYYYDSVLWAYSCGITTGKEPSLFAPNDNCLRAEVVTFLLRSMGENDDGVGKNPFVDVPATAYFHDSVLWAVKNNITNGLDATHFGPYEACTRAQVVTFLWRASGCPVPTVTTSAFTDVAPGAYYEDAVLWAVEAGITNGLDATHFSPNSTCTRAQIVTFLYRWIGIN